MVDEIIQCPVCEEWRHKSWFDVGERGCKECQEVIKSYMDNLWVAAIETESMLKGDMLRIASEETCPESISPTHWRVIHMVDRGADADGIAVAYGITVESAEQLIHDSLESLLKESERRLSKEEGLDGNEEENDTGNDSGGVSRIILPGEPGFTRRRKGVRTGRR